MQSVSILVRNESVFNPYTYIHTYIHTYGGGGDIIQSTCTAKYAATDSKTDRQTDTHPKTDRQTDIDPQTERQTYASHMRTDTQEDRHRLTEHSCFCLTCMVRHVGRAASL